MHPGILRPRRPDLSPPRRSQVSSGFDAAARDPLGGMELTPAGYAHMTRELLTLAHGRMVVALEGGYNLLSIAASASAVVAAMLGDPPPTTSHPSRLPPRVRSGARRDISLTMAELAPHWPVIDKALRQRRAEGIRGKPTLPARRDGGRENGRRARSTAWPARGSAAPRDSARLPRWYRELYGVAPAGIAAGRGRQQQRGPRRVRLPWPFSWRMTGLPRRRVVGLAMR
jgi:histone deacetylase 6